MRNLEFITRFFDPPAGSYFLFGPRGTGKSTWLVRESPDTLVVDLLDPAQHRRYLASPERLLDVVRGREDTDTVIIDEVQKAPELLDAVHKLMEEDHKLRFVLTGSSARKLKRTGVDMLAGRAVRRAMHPFLAAELGERFDLDAALQHGLVPVVVDSTDPYDTVQTYVALYIQQEVQAEGLVRNAGQFARFLEAVSFSQGSPINLSNVSRECEVHRKVVESFVEILEDMLIGVRLPVFTRRTRRATTQHPKFYFFDCGVFRALRPAGPLDRPAEIDGGALEGLVFQHLRAWRDYSGGRHELFFWRTRTGVEVDFVVYGDHGIDAVEVKNTARIRSRDLRPLKAFIEEFPQARGLMLYRGNETLRIDDIPCVPVDRFLRGLVPGTSIL